MVVMEDEKPTQRIEPKAPKMRPLDVGRALKREMFLTHLMESDGRVKPAMLAMGWRWGNLAPRLQVKDFKDRFFAIRAEIKSRGRARRERLQAANKMKLEAKRAIKRILNSR
jgi:hypothetical protein